LAKIFLVPIDIPTLAQAPVAPDPGQVYFDTTSNSLQVWTGQNWQAVPDNWLWSRLQDLEWRYRALLAEYVKVFGPIASLGDENMNALSQ
jgi:hypothetical protein